MKRILLLLLIVCCINIYAQDTRSCQAVKTSQEGGRYEIIQIEFPEPIILRLDKYKGEVYVLLEKGNGGYEWDYTYSDFFRTSSDYPNKINYQLHWGGTKNKDCFLLNINTGEILAIRSRTDGKYEFRN